MRGSVHAGKCHAGKYLRTAFYFMVSMEQRIFLIVIDYRGRCWKVITIYNAAEINKQQKIVILNKIVCLNIAERLKQ